METKNTEIVSEQKRRRRRHNDPTRQRGLNSSERGKRFRREHAENLSRLITDVGMLLGEIKDLTSYRELLKQTTLQSSGDMNGSCVNAIRQYYRVFRQGITIGPDMKPQECPQLVMQKNYLFHLMHRKMAYMETTRGVIQHGPQTLYDHWVSSCASHRRVEMLPGPIEVISSYPYVRVKAYSTLRVRYSRDTFTAYFPHILVHNAYVQSLIGLQMDIAVTRWFDFAPNGQVLFMTTHLDFLTGLVKAVGLEEAMMIIGRASFAGRYISPPVNSNDKIEEIE